MKNTKKSLEVVENAYITKLENENKTLRRENEKLRKELMIVDFFKASADRLEYLELKRGDKEAAQEIVQLKEKWLCNDCGRDSLHIHVLDFPNNTKKYYRACPHCKKRTQMKDFHNKVYGLFAKKESK